MFGATNSPVLLLRLFIQGRHINASVMLLFHNMFLWKFNADISQKMRRTLLPSEVLAIGNNLELLENAFLVRIESTLYECLS